MTTQAVPAARLLRDQLKGRTDDEIVRTFGAARGFDAALDESFAGMVQAFVPARAAGKDAIIQYDVVLPDGVSSYQVDVRNGRCVARRGAEAEAGVTLRASFPDFLRLISGQLSATKALLFGRLKVKGDLLLGQAMQGWFDQGA